MTMLDFKSHGSHSYNPPTKGILSYLPPSWVPFAELMRLSKPVGILNIYYPYLFGMLFSACISRPLVNPTSLLSCNTTIFAAAFILRSAGCTWNDIVDHKVDRLVARCRLRPIARGAVSLSQGHIFFVGQMFIWYVTIAQTRIQGHLALFATPAILQGLLYPFAKRFMDYPQLILGFALSWGIPIGCLAMGTDPYTLAYGDKKAVIALGSLYGSYVIWAVVHDTVYAFQDIQDDEKAGVRSMAVRFREHTKKLLSTLAAIQTSFLITTGVFIDAGMGYYLFACGGTSILLILMISKVELQHPASCLWWFQYGCLFFGISVSAGLIAEYMKRFSDVNGNAWGV